jgi:hypothetical protein
MKATIKKKIARTLLLGLGVFLTQTFNLDAQSRVRPEVMENQEVKIYRSLEDLLSDNSDETIEVAFMVRPKEHGITYQRLLVTRKEGKEIGRVYGFKVGNEVFINPRNPKLRKRKNFFKMERIGDYVNYATVGRIWIQGSSQGNDWRPPYRFTYPREELLHIETGKRNLLTRARLKKILKKNNNLELLKEFKQEKRKSMQLIPYLKQHEASTASN